ARPAAHDPNWSCPQCTSRRETDAQHAAPTLRADATAVKQSLLGASSHYGTPSKPTIPPSPSGTVATPLGTTQSDPSTCRLKWYKPRRSASVPSQTSSPKGRSWTGCHAFQSPAMATERASGIRNCTTRLSPRGSGTRGAHCGAAVGGGGARGEWWNRTPRVTKPARGGPWELSLSE